MYTIECYVCGQHGADDKIVRCYCTESEKEAEFIAEYFNLTHDDGYAEIICNAVNDVMFVY